MVIFRNRGLIDLAAIKTFGASSKEGSNPIGYFGTGLKYALAILLREDHQVELWRDDVQYVFDARRVTIRNDEFDVVHMNGVPLGFTTQLGKNWAVWKAYRELYCNTLDEDGEITLDGPRSCPGHTVISVRGAAFEAIHHERGRYILQTKPVVVLPLIEVHPGPASHVFYRGMRALTLAHPSRYTWNITREMRLSEDRELDSAYDAELTIAQCLAEAGSVQLLEELLTTDNTSFEGRLDFDNYNSEPNEAFMLVVGRHLRNDMLNETARNAYAKAARTTGQIPTLEPTTIEVETIAAAVKFLEDLGWPMLHPIMVTDALPESTLGTVSGGKIYLTRRVLMMGKKMTAGTLLEEHIHMTLHLRDMTRSLQNYLFDLVISLGERINGRAL